MFHWRYVVVASIVSTFLVSVAAQAQRASDRRMADEALMAATRANTPSRLQVVRSQAQLRMADVATRRGPNGYGFATIVFARGQNAMDVQSFTEAHDLQVLTAEAKIPMGTSGKVMTLSTGVSMIDGALSDRLRIGTGSMQFQLMNAARGLDGVDRENLMEAATAREFMYYRIDVLGRLFNLQSAESEQNVAVMLIDPSDERLQGIVATQARALQARRALGPPIIRRLEDGPPPGVSPDRIVPFFVP
jgi:hypothetical protein